MTKSLAKAIALATVLGASASAHAINVNHDGLGEVLLYSLYTTEEGNVTTINITNTTDQAKAVKVRFLEGQNSQEVLDFNLYLSANDQWSGAITQTANGAKIITADKSCTAPVIPAAGVEFRNTQYLGDGGHQSLKRTRVGHIEMIEMGVLDTAMAALVTADHSKSGAAGTQPADCNGLRAQFTSGIWATDIEDGFIAPALVKEGDLNGGLYGSASILNIEGSTQISYDALALDNFMDDTANGPKILHSKTGSVEPGLNDGGNNFATFKNGDENEFNNPASAISALLMKESISNDYVLDEGRGSETNWVITFPTKRFHVDSASTANLPPFVNAWKAGQSCHEVAIKNWDNEEFAGTPGDLDFSPSLPGATSSLCYETNILTFNEAKMLGGEFVSYNLNLDQPDFQFGWLNMGFTSDSGTAYQLVAKDDADVVIKGLPAVGFSAVTVKNNKAANGVMNNYGSSTNHKAKTTLDHYSY